MKIKKTTILPLCCTLAAAYAADTTPVPPAGSETPAVSTPTPEQATVPSATVETPPMTLESPRPDAAKGLTFDINVGTQGLGFALGYEFNEHLRLRARYAFLGYKRDSDWNDLPNKAELEGNNGGLLLDYHPTGGAFRLSAGITLSAQKLKADASMQRGGKVYSLGGYDYRAMDGAAVHANYDWNSLQPYVGIGWSTGVNERGLYFTADLGVNFCGKSDLKVSHAGNIQSRTRGGGGAWQDLPAGALDSRLRDSVKHEGRDFFKVADKIVVYPVLQIGVGYRW